VVIRQRAHGAVHVAALRHPGQPRSCAGVGPSRWVRADDCRPNRLPRQHVSQFVRQPRPVVLVPQRPGIVLIYVSDRENVGGGGRGDHLGRRRRARSRSQSADRYPCPILRAVLPSQRRPTSALIIKMSFPSGLNLALSTPNLSPRSTSTLCPCRYHRRSAPPATRQCWVELRFEPRQVVPAVTTESPSGLKRATEIKSTANKFARALLPRSSAIYRLAGVSGRN
jgi:hypothetical protein